MNTSDTTGTIYKQSSSVTSQITEDINGDGIGADVYYYSGNHKKIGLNLEVIIGELYV